LQKVDWRGGGSFTSSFFHRSFINLTMKNCDKWSTFAEVIIRIKVVYFWRYGVKPYFLFQILVTDRLFLLTGQKSGFSPRRGDSLHRFRPNFAGPTGTWVRLAVQNFTSIGAEGWNCGPKNIHFLVKSHLAGATPLTDFENFYWLLYA